MDREVRTEIYLSLLLLGAEPMLLAAVASWRDGEVEAVQQRIRQYEEARRALRQAA